MSAATTALQKTRRSSLRRAWWVTPAFAAFFLVIAYLIFDYIVQGKCDIRGNCVPLMLQSMFRQATPIAFAALCGVMCERSGVVNIGIEGQMLMGAMVAYAVNVYSYQIFMVSMDPVTAATMSRLLALLLGVISAVILGALHAFVSINIKANQIISGTIINILAVGITGYAYRQFLASNVPAGPGTFPVLSVPVLSQIPWIGPILFQNQPLTYVMLILVFVIFYVLYYTPWGLRTRAVGEHPRAADTLGINVYKVRYIAVLLGSVIAGLGGVWFTLESVDVFNPMMTNGLGFIGLAAMIFGKWDPFGALIGALIFGLGSTVTTTLSFNRPDIPSQIPQMLPYVLTIIVLTGLVGRAVAPAADGEPYEKQ